MQALGTINRRLRQLTEASHERLRWTGRGLEDFGDCSATSLGNHGQSLNRLVALQHPGAGQQALERQCSECSDAASPAHSLPRMGGLDQSGKCVEGPGPGIG